MSETFVAFLGFSWGFDVFVSFCRLNFGEVFSEVVPLVMGQLAQQDVTDFNDGDSIREPPHEFAVLSKYSFPALKYLKVVVQLAVRYRNRYTRGNWT